MEISTIKGEVIFSVENVVVSMVGPLKEEVAFSGKLNAVKEPHGLAVEWHPVQRVSLSPKPSPEAENLDWEDFTVVGYKAKKESMKDSVEIKKQSRTPNPITFDVSDLASFKRTDENGSKESGSVIAAFSLKDGSSIPSLQFENVETFVKFLLFLEEHVPIRRSDKDDALYLINDPDTVALTKSFNELDLFEDTKRSTFSKVLRDPYMLMGKFSKVTNIFYEYLLHPGGADLQTECPDDDVVELLNESLPRIHIDHEESGYELITCFKMPPRTDMKREEPVTPDEWHSYVDSDGRIQNFESLKYRIFKGGLTHTLRSEAWKYLLGYYSFEETFKEKEAKRKQKIDDYYRMKLQWKSITSDQESRFSALRERRNLIDKDVSRTDRTHPFYEGEKNVNLQMLYDILMTYCMYNFDLGYVQGMSDLLSPILVVMQNEVNSFWCFASWMEKIGVNFEMDQVGMKMQLLNLHRLLHFVDSELCAYLENNESGNLYFAFRWLLILFKRDFKFEEVMRLWEVLWTCLPCKNFHLLICIAILDTERTTIMENNYGLTEILKHINDMAYKLNLEKILSKAEAICHQISSCSQVPDIIQNILGLEVPTVTTEQTQSPSAEKVKNQDELQEMVLPKTRVLRQEVRRESPSNSGSSDDYVDIDEKCNLSFGLFT